MSFKTNFVDKITVVAAGWLNDVNTAIYTLLGDGTNPPASRAELQVNLGIVPAADLANTTNPAKGVFLLGYYLPFSGFIGRNLSLRLSESLSIKDFGAVGDGVTDDTIAIQKALNCGARSMRFPSTTASYRVTAPLLIVNSLNLIGEGVEPLKQGIVRGYGSWLFFDHPGVGVLFSDTQVRSGGTVKGIGTLRNQPTPGVGWAPGAFDFDFDVVNYDVVFDDIHLYNPTNGIRHRQGGFGRINCFNIRGFPFRIGIQIIESYDLCRLENIHFWPFSVQENNVWAWVQNNGHAIELYRTDNPFLTNIFTIFYQSSIYIGQNANGTANKVKVVNGDFDRGRFGINIDPGVSGHVGQYINISAQSETGLLSQGAGMWVQGSNCNLTLTNVDFRECITNAVRVQGIGNRVSIAQLKVDHNDVNGVGFPALEAATGNTIEVLGLPVMTRLGAGGKYSSTGTLLVDEWRTWTPVVVASTGNFTTLGDVSGLYKVVNNTVYVTFTIAIITNGTAAGDVRFGLPYGTPIAAFTGVGRETQSLGKSLTIHVLNASTLAAIYNFDNSYAGGDARTLTGNFQYAIAPM